MKEIKVILILVAIFAVIFLVRYKFEKKRTESIYEAFARIDSTLSTPYLNDNEKAKLLVDSINNTTYKDKAVVSQFYNNSVELRTILDSVTVRIRSGMKANDDLEIAFEVISANNLSETIYSKLKKHYHSALKLSTSDSVRKIINESYESSLLNYNKARWVKEYFEDIPAVGGITIMDYFKNNITETTLLVLSN